MQNIVKQTNIYGKINKPKKPLDPFLAYDFYFHGTKYDFIKKNPNLKLLDILKNISVNWKELERSNHIEKIQHYNYFMYKEQKDKKKYSILMKNYLDKMMIYHDEMKIYNQKTKINIPLIHYS